jgi:transketolase
MMEKISTREAYGRALLQYGDNENIVVLDADLSKCTMTCYFAGKYPQRFFNCGIAECNMVTLAAGIASTGKTVFCNSFAMFSTGRAFDQVRNSVCYPGLNVKVVGTHAGLSVGEDGATHQCIEDISLMRTIPGMTVFSPCDANETAHAVKAMIDYNGPCYLRLGKLPMEDVTSAIKGYRFEIGKGIRLANGRDVTIIATGLMVQMAIEASRQLKKENIQAGVIDIHTIKPLDKGLILEAARQTDAVVTAEEHNVIGGLGSAVAELLAREYPAPLEMVGVEDVFGHSGKPDEVMQQYCLTVEHIVQAAKRVILRKKVIS